MKLYSNVLNEQDVRNAFAEARKHNNADIWIDDVETFKPRKSSGFTNGVTFYAYSMNGNNPTAHRPIGSYSLSNVDRAASWSDYGYVIAYLFTADPDAKIGHYVNVEDFMEKVVRYPRKGQSTAFLDILLEEE